MGTVLGLGAIAGALAISLIGPHPLGLGTNAVTPQKAVVPLGGKRPVCARQPTIPRGADSVRLFATSPEETIRPITVEIRRSGRRSTYGTSATGRPGWIDVPLAHATDGVAGEVACVSSPGRQQIWLFGSRVRTGGIAAAGGRLDFTMAFQRAEPSSFLDWTRVIFRRYGYGQLSPLGSWTLLAAGLLLAVAAGLALWLVVHGPRGRPPSSRPPFGRVGAQAARIPPAAWLCALVAVLNATAWSLVVPAFAGGDERDHVAYVQHLAETGAPPSGRTAPAYSEEERNLLKGLENDRVSLRVDDRPFRARSDHLRLERLAGLGGDRTGAGGSSNASNNPPLYYAVEAVTYRLTAWTNLINRVRAMRLVSALLAGVTVMLIFLFLRELFPRVRWAWSAGSLCVAFLPLFGLISGTVKDDNLAYAAGAGLLLALAVSFKRGLDTRRGFLIGALTAVGVLSRIAVLGLVPGIAVGLLLMVHRAAPERRREAITGLIAAAAALAAPILLYMLLNTAVWDRGLLTGHPGGHRFGKPSVSAAGTNVHTISGWFGYVWQFYLPSLAGMHPHVPTYQLRHVWFEPFVGVFGYLEFEFPSVVFTVAFGVYVIVAVLALRELRVRRAAVRARLGELSTYLLMLIGLLLLLHTIGYVVRLGQTGDFSSIFEQVRYLFPLLGLYAGVIALAARGAGPVLGRGTGILLVALAISAGMAAQLITVWRFYG